MAAPNLNSEIEAYEKEKGRLVAEGHAGKYALIGDGKFVGVWDTYEDALQAGYAQFGVDRRFLVKKIEAIESIQFFTRDITACQV